VQRIAIETKHSHCGRLATEYGHYYRNYDRNWQLLAPWAGAVIHQPALFIAGKEDHVIRGPTGEKQLKDLPMTVPNLKGTVLDGVGHCVQQERPKEVTAALLDCLRMLNLTL
jgi:pimeloyl-ACP methyl ester carboxylesterase